VTSTIDDGRAAAHAEPLFGDPTYGGAAERDPRFVGPIYTGPVYAPPSKLSLFVQRAYERTPRWVAPAAIAACFLGAASYVWVSNPTDAGAADPPGCLVKITTGLDCPGCGGTRAFYYLMHANLPEAVRHHAMAVFAAPFLVWLYVAWAVKQVSGRSVPMPRVTAKAVSLLLGAWAVFMVARNIPVAPFTYLFV
jgi:hypothetical protein